MTGLASNAMLCKIAIHMWNNESVDNDSAEELAATHKVQKYIKAKRIHLPEYCLDRIRSVAGNIRNYHAANTLPFLDRGIRLLPSTNYFAYIQGLQERKNAFEEAVEDFITQLPIYISDAKQKFGSKFDESYIPSVEELRKRFRIEPTFMPIAESSDWRLQLEAEAIAELKQGYDTNLKSIQREAVIALWDSMEEGVAHLITKLDTPKARLHETLIPNLIGRAETILRLNTTQDADIISSCTDILAMLSSCSTADFRGDEHMRNITSKEAKGILRIIHACQSEYKSV